MSLSIRALALLALTACEPEKDPVPDADGDGFTSDVDCDDGDPALYPAADEVCDGVDNDCDGEADELAADALTWSIDADGDGYGEASYTVSACEQPDGYAPSGGDCDDTLDTVFPGAVEQCDGVDNDCDGLADDADPGLDASTVTTWYRDADDDGFGAAEAGGMTACSDPSTPYAPYADNADDCDDSTASAAPDLDEVCGDGLDNDCDGSDEGCAREGEIGTDAAGARLVGAAEEGVGAALGLVDSDGDGAMEPLLGAPGGSGAVYLFLPPLSGTVATSAADATLSPVDGGEGLGSAVLGLDLDGDGLGDLVSGLPGASRVAWLAGPVRGALPVLPGDGDLSGASGLGAALADGGSALGEGTAAVLVSAPDADGGAGEGSGVVFVVAAPWGAGAGLDGAPSLLGDQPGQAAGERIAAAGDPNGDGLTDLLVGAPSTADGAGLAALFLGPVSGAVSLADADVRWDGLAAGDGLGEGLAGPGDVDDDGDDDVALGAPGVASPDVDAGAVWVISGGDDGLSADLGAAVATLQGEVGARLGASVGAAGRFDDDRNDDLVVGAPGVDAAWVLFGGVEGGLLMADAELLLRGDAGGALGQAVIGGGIDGDDRDDLLVGAPTGALGGDGAGVVWLLTGSGW